MSVELFEKKVLGGKGRTNTDREKGGNERNRDLPLQKSDRKERAEVGGVGLLKGTLHLHTK